jgi:hypothetical protein
MLSTDQWFHHPERVLQQFVDKDRHAHLAIWLLARVNNLIHGKTLANIETTERLRNDLARWAQMHHAAGRPIMQVDSSSGDFPSILYSNETTATAHVMWHAATILLMQRSPGPLSPLNVSEDLYHHARSICGIVGTYKDTCPLLVEAIHPLWICGLHLRSRAEKFAVLELLARIERKTGWKTAWRAENLREKWMLA